MIAENELLPNLDIGRSADSRHDESDVPQTGRFRGDAVAACEQASPA
jgi:hypothetical protein